MYLKLINDNLDIKIHSVNSLDYKKKKKIRYIFDNYPMMILTWMSSKLRSLPVPSLG